MQTHTLTGTRNNKMSILYDDRYAPALKSLGLWHVSQLTPIEADVALLSALVERWRPETHTFHLPVGEITVSLQDVSCLWGLPITRGVHRFGSVETEPNLANQSYNSVLKIEPNRTELALQPNRTEPKFYFGLFGLFGSNRNILIFFI